MAIKRLVGIDFGTSTSVVKCKRYEDGKPIGDAHHTESVTFGQGASEPRALTIVRVNADGTVDCGIDEFLEGSTVYRDFKMSLESENAEERERAKELTHEYIKYLYDRYSYQNGFLGECDEEETIISFPAKWKDETRRFMAYAVADAGFKNVSSIDEPSAALYAILAQEMNEIRNNGFIEKDKDNLILVIDMGAGTTDLAVCKCNVNTEDSKVTATDIKNELMFSWPEDGVDITFGGREIDEKLKDFLIEYIVSCGLPKEAAENFIRNNTGVKGWKEETLSPSLGKKESTNACSVAKQAQAFAPIKKPFPEVTRESFEKLIADKIEDYKTLVKGCLDKLEENAEIDVVIFTGGHSAWYFAKELVDGTVQGIDHPALRKVQAEKKRVFSLPHPQETVALGMVYSKLPFEIINPHERDKKVTVPNFVNTSYEHFTSNKIKNEDFTFKTVYEYNQSVEKGYIISQSVKPGEMVEKGTEITFVISRGVNEQIGTAGLSGEISIVSEGTGVSLRDRAKAYLEKNKETAKNLSVGNLNGLRTYLNIPVAETIYLYKDTTWFRSGKNGFVVTDKGLYFREFGAPVVLYWYTYRDLVSIDVGTYNAAIEFRLKGGSGRTFTEFFYSQYSQALDFFVGLQNTLRNENASQPESVEPEKRERSAGAEIFLEIVEETCKAMCGPVAESDFDILRKNFNVPANAKIFFADTEYSDTQKRGTMITDRGIHATCHLGFFFGDVVHFTPWKKFIEGTITEHPVDGVKCKFDSQSRNIYYGTKKTDFMLELYTELQKYLLESGAEAPDCLNV